jgi:hypothetical protein
LDSALRWLAPIGVLAAIGVALCSRVPERSRERAESDEREPATTREHTTTTHSAARASPSSGSAPATIRAQIIDASTGPLSEGRVELRCSDSATRLSAAIDEDGHFEAPACSEDPTCVRLVHPSVEQPRAWELEPGATVELETEPAPQLLGTILSPDREPIPNAELLVQQGGGTIAITSDAAGEFAIAFPRLRPCDRCDQNPGEPHCRADPTTPPATARVLASAPGFAPHEQELTLADPSQELILTAPAPAITGRVLGPDGEPFDRTRVLATNRARAHEQHATEVDARGRFAFEQLAAAEYSLRAIRDERELATLALARPGDDIELRADTSARASALTVEIVDADGDPIAGARIDGGPWRAALSDARGRVEATAVLPGSYTVRVRATDCAPVREAITLEPSETAWLRRVQLPDSC